MNISKNLENASSAIHIVLLLYCLKYSSVLISTKKDQLYVDIIVGLKKIVMKLPKNLEND